MWCCGTWMKVYKSRDHNFFFFLHDDQFKNIKTLPGPKDKLHNWNLSFSRVVKLIYEVWIQGYRQIFFSRKQGNIIYLIYFILYFQLIKKRMKKFSIHYFFSISFLNSRDMDCLLDANRRMFALNDAVLAPLRFRSCIGLYKPSRITRNDIQNIWPPGRGSNLLSLKYPNFNRTLASSAIK
jgi:hypothetical protein